MILITELENFILIHEMILIPEPKQLFKYLKE